MAKVGTSSGEASATNLTTSSEARHLEQEESDCTTISREWELYIIANYYCLRTKNWICVDAHHLLKCTFQKEGAASLRRKWVGIVVFHGNRFWTCQRSRIYFVLWWSLVSSHTFDPNDSNNEPVPDPRWRVALEHLWQLESWNNASMLTWETRQEQWTSKDQMLTSLPGPGFCWTKQKSIQTASGLAL